MVTLSVPLLVPGIPLVAQKRPLDVNDVYNLKDVRDPQRSPDGKWVAYVVARAIKDTDKNDTDIWMASWDGTQEIQVTSSPDGESQPRWSPDNKYLSFVSSRQGAKDGQLWLLNRAGGEAVKVSDVKGGVSEYAWSPDSKRLVFVVSEPDPRDPKDDENDRRQEEDPAADRHRSLSLQGGRPGLSAQRADASLPVRRRDEEGRGPHLRHRSTRSRRRPGRPTGRRSPSSASAAPATSIATTTPTSG